MTNMECIRKWTDEEFADFTAGIIRKMAENVCEGMGIDYSLPDNLYKKARDEWLAWLKEEAGCVENDEA